MGYPKQAAAGGSLTCPRVSQLRHAITSCTARCRTASLRLRRRLFGPRCLQAVHLLGRGTGQSAFAGCMLEASCKTRLFLQKLLSDVREERKSLHMSCIKLYGLKNSAGLLSEACVGLTGPGLQWELQGLLILREHEATSGVGLGEPLPP